MCKYKFLTVIVALLSVISHNVKAQDKIIDHIVAVIGSNVILKSGIEAIYLQNQAQGITSEGDMKCEILERLLIEKLMVAEAEMDTLIIVTDNQVNQQMDARIQYFVQHLGSEKEVENYFKKPIVKLKSELKDVIHNEILSSQMNNKIIDKIKVTPSEVRYFYKSLPEEEKPLINTQYEYSQITIIPWISETEENKIKDQLRELKRRAEEGENFSMFAVLYSECPSAKNGGDLGYFGKAAMDPAFSAAAFALRPGQISNVVKSEAGYHIIKMEDRLGERIKCRHVLLKPKVSAEVKEKSFNVLDSLATEIRKGSLKFEEAAYRYSMDKNSRNNGGMVINPNDLSSKFEIGMLQPEISKILTSLEINEISKPFISIDQNGRDVIQIVKLLNKVESHKANLNEDYQLISELFLEKKRNGAIEEWIGQRQSKTYIRIDDTYLNCDFKFKNWIK